MQKTRFCQLAISTIIIAASMFYRVTAACAQHTSQVKGEKRLGELAWLKRSVSDGAREWHNRYLNPAFHLPARGQYILSPRMNRNDFDAARICYASPLGTIRVTQTLWIFNLELELPQTPTQPISEEESEALFKQLFDNSQSFSFAPKVPPIALSSHPAKIPAEQLLSELGANLFRIQGTPNVAQREHDIPLWLKGASWSQKGRYITFVATKRSREVSQQDPSFMLANNSNWFSASHRLISRDDISAIRKAREAFPDDPVIRRSDVRSLIAQRPLKALADISPTTLAATAIADDKLLTLAYRTPAQLQPVLANNPRDGLDGKQAQTIVRYDSSPLITAPVPFVPEIVTREETTKYLTLQIKRPIPLWAYTDFLFDTRNLAEQDAVNRTMALRTLPELEAMVKQIFIEAGDATIRVTATNTQNTEGSIQIDPRNRLQPPRTISWLQSPGSVTFIYTK
jgi:hypothetical protein